MKKIAFLFAALLTLGFTSCEDKSDLGQMQTNPQEAVMAADGVSVKFGKGLEQSTLDLSAYQTDVNIPVIELTEAKDLPEGATVSFVMELATQPDYSDATLFPVTNGTVSATDWDAWFRSKLGKSPAAKDNYVRFAAYITSGTVVSRVGGQDVYLGAKKISVTPVPLDIKIEEAYYFIGTGNGWQLDTSMPFKHSNESVYDDPVFTVAFEITEEQAADGYWWKIAPKSAIESGDWATVIGIETNGDESMSGLLFDPEEGDPGAGCIKEAGSFIMTINMIDMTYAIDKMTYLYTPGNSNDWNQGNSQMLTYNSESGKFTGFAHLNGEFKFTNQPNWDGTNYGSTGTEGELSTDPGAGNLNAAADGLYYCEVDIDNLTYTITPITTWGLIGDFNGWGSSVAMTPSDNFLTWEGEITVEEGNGWKFRANDDWAINLGGALTKLVANGDNLVLNGAGTFKITLDFTSIPYTASAVKK